ncbi:MAG: histidinol dehydrogenase [Crocinitomicaceae bacterium]|nr:histidinol dehydrogenase [Crocinitomicaceae bacterium]
MKTIINPAIKEWSSLIQRPSASTKVLDEIVDEVFQAILTNGDKALFDYTKKFDQVELKNLLVERDELKYSSRLLSDKLKKAIKLAYTNISKFHKSQREKVQKIETSTGVICWRESRAIERVGIYIPGGSAPLFSTVLMLGIPAKIAGCSEIILCTPPDKSGKINPAILYCAYLIGVDAVYAVGGIQAIGAMTFGTKSIPRVSKIFGPGNQYVTAAKQRAQNFGLAIDMPAGPSELLIIADKKSNPEFVAADLLSQAEHGEDSQVILLSTSAKLIQETKKSLSAQLEKLPRKKIATEALKNSYAIQLRDEVECISFSNMYAPEHLILACEKADILAKSVVNAGSVFIGKYACESAGDYASGTNHTLPTNGYAKNYSGVSLDSFVRKITFQKISKLGIQKIGPAIELMAEAEELIAHKNAVSVRLKKSKK